MFPLLIVLVERGTIGVWPWVGKRFLTTVAGGRDWDTLIQDWILSLCIFLHGVNLKEHYCKQSTSHFANCIRQPKKHISKVSLGTNVSVASSGLAPTTGTNIRLIEHITPPLLPCQRTFLQPLGWCLPVWRWDTASRFLCDSRAGRRRSPTGGCFFCKTNKLYLIDNQSLPPSDDWRLNHAVKHFQTASEEVCSPLTINHTVKSLTGWSWTQGTGCCFWWGLWSSLLQPAKQLCSIENSIFILLYFLDVLAPTVCCILCQTDHRHHTHGKVLL